MPGLIFNNKEIKKILFNGTELSAGYFNGVKFWPAVYEPVTYEVIIKSSKNINLRTLFNSAHPLAQLHENVTVRFKQENNSIVSSNSTTVPALVTGTWENDVKLEYEMGAGSYIVGRGGNGGGGSYTRIFKSLPFPFIGVTFWAANKGSVKSGGNGGTAVALTYPIIFLGNGIIGGGSGGGTSYTYNLYETIGYAAYNNYMTVGGDGGYPDGLGGIVTGNHVDYGGGVNGSTRNLSYITSYSNRLGEDAEIPANRRDISYGTPGKGGSAVVGKLLFTSTANITIKGKVL